MNLKSVFARFLGDRRSLQILALYIALGVVTRLLEDTFQTAGWLPTDENTDAPILAMAAVTIFSLLWTLLASSLQLTALSGFIRPRRVSFVRTIELLIIETIRMISATLIRIPLLILPAIYEWIRLIPVPFVVLFDPAYAKGEVDALKRSRGYFRSHTLRVLGLMIPSVVLMGGELTMTLSPEDALPLWQAPLQHIGSIAGFALARLALDAFILTMYARTFDKLTASEETMSNI